MKNLAMRESADEEQVQRAYFSNSLARGLTVLCCFGPDRQQLRISEIARLTGISRAAVRRFLLTLRDLGYVSSDGDRYFLRPRALDIGYSFLSSANVASLVQPILTELAEKTKEATTFAVLDKEEVLVVARASKRQLDLTVSIGARLPVAPTALGQVLVAHLDPPAMRATIAKLGLPAAAREAFEKKLAAVPDNGYASIDGDLSPGLKSVAIPIRDADGNTVAALNVTTNTTPLNEFIDQVLPVLRETGLQLEAAIRHSANWQKLPELEQV